MKIIQHYALLHNILKYAGMFPMVEDIQGAMKLVTHYRIKSEVIESCLYCFTSTMIGCQLEAIGFWYSFKHDAYVFSGNPKEGFADDESLDEIRARLGNYQIN